MIDDEDNVSCTYNVFISLYCTSYLNISSFNLLPFCDFYDFFYDYLKKKKYHQQFNTPIPSLVYNHSYSSEFIYNKISQFSVFW